MKKQQEPSVYEFFMLVLCILSLVMLTIDLVHTLDPETSKILDVFDFLGFLIIHVTSGQIY